VSFAFSFYDFDEKGLSKSGKQLLVLFLALVLLALACKISIIGNKNKKRGNSRQL